MTLQLVARKNASTPPTSAHHRSTNTYDCPWCGQAVEVEVFVKVHNNQQSGGPRLTYATVQRSEPTIHECPGP